MTKDYVMCVAEYREYKLLKCIYSLLKVDAGFQFVTKVANKFNINYGFGTVPTRLSKLIIIYSLV